MLASKQFIRSNLINGKVRMFRRETYLDERPLPYSGKACMVCHRVLHYNEKVAITNSLTIICHNCYCEMDDKVALQQVTEDEMKALIEERLDGVPVDEIGLSELAKKSNCTL